MNHSAANELPVILVGLNHKVAPVEVREQLAFGPDRTISALHELVGDKAVIREAVILSTCNRSEVYLAAADPIAAISQVHSFLSAHGSLPLQELQRVVYMKQGARSSARSGALRKRLSVLERMGRSYAPCSNLRSKRASALAPRLPLARRIFPWLAL
jgi:hypothetical protein